MFLSFDLERRGIPSEDNVNPLTELPPATDVSGGITTPTGSVVEKEFQAAQQCPINVLHHEAPV